MEKCADLKVSPDGRFVIKKDGSPFFWLAVPNAYGRTPLLKNSGGNSTAH